MAARVMLATKGNGRATPAPKDRIQPSCDDDSIAGRAIGSQAAASVSRAGMNEAAAGRCSWPDSPAVLLESSVDLVRFDNAYT
jgi:hypothetical protein